jgi:N4-(beta-N-acetylglucosaminyl)-L-asparaginase
MRGGEPIAIATWDFGLVAVEAAGALLAKGKCALDAVEAGIRAVEADPKVRSVGFGSLPNADGVVELDAAIMDGRTHRAGAVAAIRATKHPISVARAVMQKSGQVMLVGEGARAFARARGFPPARLLTAEARSAWLRRRRRGHDTVAVLALDTRGGMAGGCSTSGLPNKRAGRVGDSPIIGAGLYCDNEAGAAGATGIGEYVMRVCGSHLIVMLMGQGLSPEKACLRALEEVREKALPGRVEQVAFLALGPDGSYGAGALRPGFRLAVWRREEARVLDVQPIAGERATPRRKVRRRDEG